MKHDGVAVRMPTYQEDVEPFHNSVPSEQVDEPSVPEQGIYRHYKGGLYRVVAVGRHSESKEALVAYECLGTGEW